MLATKCRTFIVAVVVALGLPACDALDPTAAPELAAAPAAARFVLAPALPAPGDFVYPITTANANPYFPLLPGTIWTYQNETDEGLETTVVTVTDQTRTIQGITATVVLDQVSLDGQLVEVTHDWYAQDAAGNVWYLGEESCEYDPPGSATCDPAGSWETGLDIAAVGSSAEAGIIMWADPLAHKGKAYRQEYYEGEAEDMARVLHGDLDITVHDVDFTDCIETMDWSPLEPGAREHKFYCAGFGMVLEVSPSGGNARNELVSFTSPSMP